MTITTCRVCGESFGNDSGDCPVCGTGLNTVLFMVGQTELAAIIQRVRGWDQRKNEEYVDYNIKLADAVQKMRRECNDLLRSAYQIAEREGRDTNWEAFGRNLTEELLVHAGVFTCPTDQDILKATCTPKTYRITHTVAAGTCGQPMTGAPFSGQEVSCIDTIFDSPRR